MTATMTLDDLKQAKKSSKRKQALTKAFNVAEMTKDQREVWDEANDALRDSLVWLCQYLADDANHTIMRRWQLGKALDRITSSPDKYGQHSWRSLKTFFDMGSDILSASHAVFEIFTKEDLQALIKQRRKDGFPILWSHVVVLSRIKDPELRHEIQEKMIEESWGPKQLLAYSQDEQGGKRSPGGRKVQVPATFLDCLQQAETQLTTICHRSEEAWHFKELFQSHPPQVLDSKLRTRVGNLIKSIDGAMNDLEANHRELTRIHSLLPDVNGRPVITSKPVAVVQEEDDEESE